MSGKNHERPSGAVDPVMFEKVIPDNLSPDGVAAVIAFQRTASVNAPTTEAQRQALVQVEWLADTLAVVRVVEIKQIPPPSCSREGRWQTLIKAVNEATGKRITIRSPQRLRKRLDA